MKTYKRKLFLIDKRKRASIMFAYNLLEWATPYVSICIPPKYTKSIDIRILCICVRITFYIEHK